MKKVIAAAAGLMLVGTMVSTASAAVSLSGDARVRGYLERNYDAGGTPRTNEVDDKLHSRVRIKATATAKGGASATARFKIGDGTFGDSLNADVKTDYAYVTVPMGPVTGIGGRIPLDLTKFSFWDETSDALILKWANDMTEVAGWYVKTDELLSDKIDDNDLNMYAAYLKQKFSGDWGMTAGVLYVDNQLPGEDSGWAGIINFTGPAGPVAFAGELAYQNSDFHGGVDDGFGGYIQGGMDFGATNVAINAGFTKDGFTGDNDFGFIMIGGASSITPAVANNVGLYGDWWWIGGTMGFAASEKLSFAANLVYADIDASVNSLFEVSGKMVYVISDGANFQWDIGYLSVDSDAADSEDPFGTAATFNISF